MAEKGHKLAFEMHLGLHLEIWAAAMFLWANSAMQSLAHFSLCMLYFNKNVYLNQSWFFYLI